MFGVRVCYEEAQTVFPSHSLNLEQMIHCGVKKRICVRV